MILTQLSGFWAVLWPIHVFYFGEIRSGDSKVMGI